MADYTSDIISAEADIKAAGTAMTLSRTVDGTYDPATGTTTGDVTTEYPCYGMYSKFRSDEIDGTNIKFGDAKVLMGASTLTVSPQDGDKLVVGSDTWSVVRNDPVQPDGTPIIHRVQARKD